MRVHAAPSFPSASANLEKWCCNQRECIGLALSCDIAADEDVWHVLISSRLPTCGMWFILIFAPKGFLFLQAFCAREEGKCL